MNAAANAARRWAWVSWRWALSYSLPTLLTAFIGFGALIGLLVALYGPLTHFAAGRTIAGISDPMKKATAINAVRQTLLLTSAGVVGLVGLAFTGRTFNMSRRGQLTDRYSKAVSQLSSDKIEERLGAIYSLEHVMRESSRDHHTIVEILAAFVRQRSPYSPSGPEGRGKSSASQNTVSNQRSPALDVQAVLHVLGRRPARREKYSLDLRNCDLRGADLAKAYLRNVRMDGACLDGANLFKADLRGAMMIGACIRSADLSYAHMEKAIVVSANLQNSIFAETRLQGARAAFAQLQGAYLIRTRLQQADLALASLSGAFLCGTEAKKVSFMQTDLQHAHLDRVQVIEHVGIGQVFGVLTAHFNGSVGGLRGILARGADLRHAKHLAIEQLLVAHVDQHTLLDAGLRRKLEFAGLSPTTMLPVNDDGPR
jgi:uncharacterized protein YjbI with pentapeptide repeats